MVIYANNEIEAKINILNSKPKVVAWVYLIMNWRKVMFTVNITENKQIAVLVNEKLTKLASDITNRETIVFETEDDLAEVGGGMALATEETIEAKKMAIILLSVTGFKDNTTREAMFYHECGHVYYNHIATPAFAMPDKTRTYAEFEADLFMSRHVGKMKSIHALTNLPMGNWSQTCAVMARISVLVYGKWFGWFFRNTFHYTFQ